MLSIRKKLFKNRKGFTLIELIVVIAILAILAVLAVPRFLGTLEDARLRTDQASARTIASAFTLYQIENPTAAAALTDGTGVVDALVTAEYLDTSPLVQSGDDRGANFYVDLGLSDGVAFINTITAADASGDQFYPITTLD